MPKRKQDTPKTAKIYVAHSDNVGLYITAEYTAGYYGPNAIDFHAPTLLEAVIKWEDWHNDIAEQFYALLSPEEKIRLGIAQIGKKNRWLPWEMMLEAGELRNELKEYKKEFHSGKGKKTNQNGKSRRILGRSNKRKRQQK